MDRSSSPIEHPKLDDEQLPPILQSTEQPVDRESSSDDIPLRQRRPARAPTYDRESSYNLRDRRRPRDHMREISDTSLLEQRRAAHQATLRKSPKTTAKSSSKTPKKPGPRAWATRPIKKNDMDAKKEVIREIETYWGKGFTRAYIPKCHRPLVKRGKGGKRAMYRDHETDPKKWLPSVLKSILSLAKLTQNKAWLKKAMNDVVRYRIKNTGNRKPQLVTTDFDVLEDILVKDWDVPFSFSVRYKHLLVNRQGQQETDEDIDHIMGVGSGGEEVSEDEHDEDDDVDVGVEDEEDVVDEDDSEEESGQGGITGQYLHKSGYIGASQYLPSDMSGQKQKGKAEKGGNELPSRPQPPSRSNKNHHGYGYPYHPMDPWGRPIPYGAAGPDGYGGYSGYGMYGGYGGYGPSPDGNSRQPSQPPTYYGMGHWSPPHQSMNPAPSQPDTDRASRQRSRGPSTGSNKRMRNNFEQSPHYTGHPGFPPYSYAPSYPDGQGHVKQESPQLETHREEREASIDEVQGPVDEIGEDSNAAAIEAELRATELELKVARLQARRAALSQQSRAK